MMITVSLTIAAMVVLWKTIEVCSSIDIHNFDGPPVHFMAMAIYWSLFGAGSVAVAAGLEGGGALLLIGLAVSLLDNRRRVR